MPECPKMTPADGGQLFSFAGRNVDPTPMRLRR
jgi:hypothetical protein